MCPGHLFSQENSDKALVILNPEISTWPLIWFYTLVFAVLLSPATPLV